MVLGMSTSTFTALHVLMSFIGIGSGLVVLYGFLKGRRLNGINATFLISTVLTSVTGFAFPVEHLMPSHIVGSISLVLLAVAILGWYMFHLAGSWSRIYVITASAALYLNVFVLVVQSFAKVPALKALAPTQKEAPFVIAQLLVLVAFVGLTVLAVRNFHKQPAEIRARAA